MVGDISLGIQLCPKKGINPTILLWGWDWAHETYSREGYGCLGYNHPIGSIYQETPVNGCNNSTPGLACGYSQRRKARRMANSPLGPSRNTAWMELKFGGFPPQPARVVRTHWEGYDALSWHHENASYRKVVESYPDCFLKPLKISTWISIDTWHED